jgi:hypothetical protein
VSIDQSATIKKGKVQVYIVTVSTQKGQVGPPDVTSREGITRDDD